MPEAFAGLTPREFAWLVEGRDRRERRAWFRLARLASWLLTPWSKRTPTAEQLLGWGKGEEP